MSCGESPGRAFPQRCRSRFKYAAIPPFDINGGVGAYGCEKSIEFLHGRLNTVLDDQSGCGCGAFESFADGGKIIF